MKYRILPLLLLLFAACSKHPSLPSSYTQMNDEPVIWPDYTKVTVPPNIVPLNFLVDDVDDVIAEFKIQGSSQNSGVDETKFRYGGKANKVQIDEDEWHEMLASAKGKSLSVTVYTKKDGKWSAYKPFPIYVAEEEIDPYISYRVLPPTFVGYDELSIRQRNLTNFEESIIYNNRQISKGLEGQCINCHSYQNYSTDNMMFHMRLQNPGTMIVNDGELIFVNLKNDEMISAAAYNSWHPSLPIIAFSTDHTMQSFHTREVSKVEVMESASDIIIYDIKKNSVQTVLNDSLEFELFPSWSPDGKWIYYCSAHYEYQGKYEDTEELLDKYKTLQYNLYRISFDAESMTFGEPELIYDAVAKNRSAVQPRVSQDGRYVLFAEGPWGLFHIWHTSAEIQVLDLQTGQLLDTKPINSDLPESYASFSSNDHWILFESRRDDGNYTRTYFAYFDKQGRLHKPFEVPAEDPEFFRLFLRSWSRPEFMKEPVHITPRQFYEKALTEPIKVAN
ncbi:MAG: PD40 domain-containing protein [Bacteroidaceae bacterium]|nr:PD40 domain-containing protein [Bacteroidaceae bacterium]